MGGPLLVFCMTPGVSCCWIYSSVAQKRGAVKLLFCLEEARGGGRELEKREGGRRRRKGEREGTVRR